MSRRAVRVRAERAGEEGAVRAVQASAFATAAEADLVSALRRQAGARISLVAEVEGIIVGHILFSPVELSGHPKVRVMGLGPMAVSPGHQRRGIGSRLVLAGLGRCRELGFEAVVVLGHPDYYPRFGFAAAAHSGVGCEFEVPQEAFMILELQPGVLEGVTGQIRYPEAFKAV